MPDALVATDGEPLPPSQPPDPLARARLTAIYVLTALLAASVVLDLIVESSHLDAGVFATLAGALLTLLGAGALARAITVSRKP